MTMRISGAPERAVDLREYWSVLLRRRWVAVTICGLVTALAGIRAFTRTPVYSAHTLLEIQRLAPDVTAFRDMVRSDNAWQGYGAFYETQYEILRSRRIARAAAEALDLPHHPLFAPEAPGLAARAFSALKSLLPGMSGSAGTGENDPLEPGTEWILAGLRVGPVKDSNLVSLDFSARDPRLAAQTADAVAEAYIQYTVRSQFDTTTQASDFLSGRSQELREQVEALEGKLQSYREERAILPDPASGNIEVKGVADLHQMFTTASAHRIEAESDLVGARSTDPASLPEVVSSPTIQDLQRTLDELQIRRSELLRTFKPDWPDVAALTRKIEGATQRLDEQVRAISASVIAAKVARHRVAMEEEERLGALLDRQKTTAQKSTRDSLEFGTLQAEINRKRDVLDSLMQRQSEISVASQGREMTSGNARIVDRALVPRSPASPRPMLEIPFGFLIGLLLGLGGAFAVEAWDNTVRSAEDVERVVGLPVLARIPRADAELPAGSGPRPGNPADLISHHAPASHMSEAFRDLRTALALSSAGDAPRIVAVTSSRPQEGKSTVALNLSIVLAQAGRRVLLVDADLRRPRLHRALGLRPVNGLSSLLCGRCSLEDAILASAIPGLSILPSGPIPPNPAELLDSTRFDALLAELRAAPFDVTVLDAPPLLTVTDASIISARADAALLVIEADATTREDARRALEKLRQVSAHSIGVVLNGVDEIARAYGYYREPGDTPAQEMEGAGDELVNQDADTSGTRAKWARRLARAGGRLRVGQRR